MSTTPKDKVLFFLTSWSEDETVALRELHEQRILLYDTLKYYYGPDECDVEEYCGGDRHINDPEWDSLEGMRGVLSCCEFAFMFVARESQLTRFAHNVPFISRLIDSYGTELVIAAPRKCYGGRHYPPTLFRVIRDVLKLNILVMKLSICLCLRQRKGSSSS